MIAVHNFVKVSWHNQRGEQIREHKLRVPKDAAVSDLIAALQNAEPDAAKAKGIRLMETLNSKIYKVGAKLVLKARLSFIASFTIEDASCKLQCRCIHGTGMTEQGLPADWLQ